MYLFYCIFFCGDVYWCGCFGCCLLYCFGYIVGVGDLVLILEIVEYLCCECVVSIWDCFFYVWLGIFGEVGLWCVFW